MREREGQGATCVLLAVGSSVAGALAIQASVTLLKSSSYPVKTPHFKL